MSTSNPPRRKYHHGDLREALLAEGLRLIETGGADVLSLREVARAAGVSATAVYRHFPDKRALMEALAHEGRSRLYAVQSEAAAAAPHGLEFEATGRAYVRFALSQPGLFRVTFQYPGVLGEAPVDDDAGAMLHENALALSRGNETEARLVALRAWSIVHGLALLMLDGRVPADDALIDAVLSSAAMFGQGRRSEASP
jgi:AcrR family transcriptional regulator